MEIKQGDKVRVSKDAPLLYTEGRIDWEAAESTVGRIDGDAAEIDNINEDDDELYSIVIPVKYLVKVDAEAKEARFKVGDWVKIGETPNPQLNGRVGTISQIDKEGYEISFNDGFFTVVSEEDLSLTDEPTEQEKAEKFAEQTKLVCGMMDLIEPPFRTIPKIMFNTEFWIKYEADLAKEVALKVANEYNAHEAAEYAVSVAKAVVKNLKQK